MQVKTVFNLSNVFKNVYELRLSKQAFYIEKYSNSNSLNKPNWFSNGKKNFKFSPFVNYIFLSLKFYRNGLV